jgi:hypothetical protein
MSIQDSDVRLLSRGAFALSLGQVLDLELRGCDSRGTMASTA